MKKQINERELALAALLAVEQGEKSHIALRQILEKYQYLDKRERAFVTRVTEGTLERRLELDYLIDKVSKVKTAKMKPVIRCIIRSGAYQIKYMDNVPDSAACNEAVKLAVKKGFAPLKGFVNGVLRSFARSKDAIPYPPKEHTAEYLSVVYSMPRRIVEMWLADYGKERTVRLLESFYEERPTVIRVNENQLTREELKSILREEGVTAEEHPDVESALMISGYDYLGGLESFREGKFQVQDAASIRVAESAGIKPGDYVIDVCAAPGGKALHAAQLLDGTGFVEARDLTDHKVALIQENIDRMGFENIRAFRYDATVPDEKSREKADVVLADLPCSGLGVLSKKTDLKYRVTAESMQELARLQRQILETVKDYVKPGGCLIYSTCTINKTENEENARWFAESFGDFALEEERQIFPARDTDGFYIARFRRNMKSRA